MPALLLPVRRAARCLEWLWFVGIRMHFVFLVFLPVQSANCACKVRSLSSTFFIFINDVACLGNHMLSSRYAHWILVSKLIARCQTGIRTVLKRIESSCNKWIYFRNTLLNIQLLLQFILQTTFNVLCRFLHIELGILNDVD